MESVQRYVGLDYHTKSIQVCVMDQNGRQISNRKCGNSLAQVLAVLAGGPAPSMVAIESCCGAADLAQRLRDDAGWPVVLAHPGYVSRMRLNPDKTDYSDAKMLAELCRVGMVPLVWLAPAPIRDLRTLVRLRADLVGRVRALKTQILALLRSQRIAEPENRGRRWTLKWFGWLTKDAELTEDAAFTVKLKFEELKQKRRDIQGVEARMEERTKNDPVLKRLRTIKGIGPVTAWTMRAMIGEFHRFNSGKQLARFCAVTPRNASSGTRMADSGLIRAGDPLLKTVLIEAAHRIRRYDARWKKLYENLKSRGKPTCVAVAAVANRWIRGVYHTLKEQDQTTLPAAA